MADPSSLAPIATLIEQVRQVGPVGAVIAAVLLGLVLATIVLAITRGLWASKRSEAQIAGFQARLIDVMDKLCATEEALRKRLDVVEGENEALRDEKLELETTLGLVRNQRARMIELLRDVMAGRIGPEAIDVGSVEAGAP